jgi:thiazole synthase ThiGH ThiG subunit
MDQLAIAVKTNNPCLLLGAVKYQGLTDARLTIVDALSFADILMNPVMASANHLVLTTLDIKKSVEVGCEAYLLACRAKNLHKASLSSPSAGMID